MTSRICDVCYGDKTLPVANAVFGSRYETCRRCNGTGRIDERGRPAYGAAAATGDYKSAGQKRLESNVYATLGIRRF